MVHCMKCDTYWYEEGHTREQCWLAQTRFWQAQRDRLRQQHQTETQQLPKEEKHDEPLLQTQFPDTQFAGTCSDSQSPEVLTCPAAAANGELSASSHRSGSADLVHAIDALLAKNDAAVSSSSNGFKDGASAIEPLSRYANELPPPPPLPVSSSHGSHRFSRKELLLQATGTDRKSSAIAAESSAKRIKLDSGSRGRGTNGGGGGYVFPLEAFIDDELNREMSTDEVAGAGEGIYSQVVRYDHSAGTHELLERLAGSGKSGLLDSERVTTSTSTNPTPQHSSHSIASWSSNSGTEVGDRQVSSTSSVGGASNYMLSSGSWGPTTSPPN